MTSTTRHCTYIALVVLVAASGCGEEIDVDLLLPRNSPCYNPQANARSVLVEVGVANRPESRHRRCFRTNVPIEPNALQKAISASGALASDLSTEEPLVAYMITFGDDACKQRQVCFSAPVSRSSQPIMTMASCERTGWAACPLPPRPPL